MINCSVCGNSTSIHDYCCSTCGTPVKSLTPSAEYHFVTILFTDLSGYSQLSEILDHEELQSFMGMLMQTITQIISEFGGNIEKYIGDAVVAIFGNKKAKEDDSVKAILAAKKIHKAVEELNDFLPENCKIRISMHSGINSGEVLIGSSHAFQAAQLTLGQPINVASRLCDLAPEGDILIGESLASEASRYFNIEWMGRKIFKGFKTPIHVYRVIKERETPVPIHRVGGVTSTLVGRDYELSILASKAHMLLSGHGGFIRIVGDAGIGKSRLIQEFKALLGDKVVFLSACCFDHTKATPYFPFTKLLADLLGDYDLNDIPEKYTPYVEFFMDRASMKDLSQNADFKEKIIDAILWLMNKKASTRPTVFCIEDIHWADQSTLDLLTYFIHEWDESFPCLLIVSHRPSLRQTLPGTRINLKELSESEVGRMLRFMLEARIMQDKTIHSLTKASGGNPFYIEELVNYLLEKGVDIDSQGQAGIYDGLPMTIYGLVSSRMDNLGIATKRILQEAALIGRVFQMDLLARICTDPDNLPKHMEELERYGFIVSAGEAKYSFKHDVTRDVAVRTVLKKDKLILHKKIVMYLEDIKESFQSDHFSKLAYHLSRSQELSKAAHYYIEAAKLCQSSGSWVEAGDHFLWAQDCVLKDKSNAETTEVLVDIREGIWRCCRVFDPNQAIAALEANAYYFLHSGYKDQEAFCHIRLINLYSQKGLFEKARNSYDYALYIIKDDQVLVAAAHTGYAYTYTFLGKPIDALRLLDSARPVLKESNDFLYAVNVMTTLAANVWKGDMKNSRYWYDETKILCKAYLDIDLMAEMWLAHICCLEGRFDEAKRVFEDVSSRELKLGRLAGGLSYLRIQGSIYFRSRYFADIIGAHSDLEAFNVIAANIHNSEALKGLYKAWIALQEGRPAHAKDLTLTAMPGLRTGIANRVPYALNLLAEACLGIGELSKACDYAEEGIAWNEQNGNIDQLICGLRIIAEISILQGNYFDAGKTLKRAFSLARVSGMKPHQAWILRTWGNLFKVKRQDKEAAICFNKSLGLWQDIGSPPHIAIVREELKNISP